MAPVTVVLSLKITHPLQKVYTATISGWCCLTNFCKKYYSIFSPLYRGGHAVWYKHVCIYIKLRISYGFQPFHSSICKCSGFLLFLLLTFFMARWPLADTVKHKTEVGLNRKKMFETGIWSKSLNFVDTESLWKCIISEQKLWFQMLFHLILVLSLSQI